MKTPIHSIALACLGVVASGLLVSNSPVYLWVWFNVFIASYEVYIYIKRNALSRTRCTQDFWTTPINTQDVPLRAWKEYACVADQRYIISKGYFVSGSYVYLFELLNVALVATLCFAWFNNKYKLIRQTLVLQALVCIVYFATLYQDDSFRRPLSIKSWIYWMISALWVVVPLALLSRQEYQ